MNNQPLIFLIPSDNGLPGPLCRLVREEKARYYVSLDYSGEDPRSSKKNRRGINGGISSGSANLWVAKSCVLAIGEDLTVETQMRLNTAIAGFARMENLRCIEDRRARDFFQYVRDVITQQVLSGNDVLYPINEHIMPAGGEYERLRCKIMAEKVAGLGPDFKDVVDYLVDRSGQKFEDVLKP